MASIIFVPAKLLNITQTTAQKQQIDALSSITGWQPVKNQNISLTFVPNYEPLARNLSNNLDNIEQLGQLLFFQLHNLEEKKDNLDNYCIPIILKGW